jgi:monofunctional glycosyltransferase
MQKSTKILLGATLAAFVLAGAIFALVLDVFTSVPDFTELRSSVKVVIYLPDGKKAFRWVGPKAAGWAPMDQIANEMLMAIISEEDTSYFSHKGVDYYELKESIKKDFQEKRWARGASTLTQQVIKNVYLTREKTLWRKIKELLWARQLDRSLSKSEVLCFYANMAEWGPGIYGIREASYHYFNIPPAKLTAKQSAFLAMLLPSPVRYHVYFKRKQLTPWAVGRINRILNIMNTMGYIDDTTYQDAQKEPLWGVAPTPSDVSPPGEPNDLPSSDPSLPQSDPAPAPPASSAQEAPAPSPSPKPEKPETPKTEQFEYP